jgi:uncharacterized membrane protein YfcA
MVLSILARNSPPIFSSVLGPGLAGAWLGLRVFQKLTDMQFRRLVNLALIISGVALVLK